jgi:hypothetical protein
MACLFRRFHWMQPVPYMDGWDVARQTDTVTVRQTTK